MYEYKLNGSSLANGYINFRIDNIMKFIEIVLPNNKMVQKYRTKIFDYYISSRLKKTDYGERIKAENSSILEILNMNDIKTLEIGYICLCLFGAKELLNWKYDENIEKRKSFIELSAYVYIGTLFDKNIYNQNYSFDEILTNIINSLKQSIDIDILLNILEKKNKLKKEYFKNINKNNKYLDFIKNYNLFKINLLLINNPDNEKLYLSNFSYNFELLKEENKRDAQRILNQIGVKNDFKKTELDIVALNILQRALNNERIKVIIDINEEYLSSKENFNYLLRSILVIKDYIMLSFSYNALSKYEEKIEELKAKNISIVLNVSGETEIDSRKSLLNGIEYIIVKYENTDDFNKLIESIQDTKIKPIVSFVNKEIIDKLNITYYIEYAGERI